MRLHQVYRVKYNFLNYFIHITYLLNEVLTQTKLLLYCTSIQSTITIFSERFMTMSNFQIFLHNDDDVDLCDFAIYSIINF